MARALRQMVSKKKKRFTEDDFNLDLSYITPQIIAMGVPADTLERLFRNNIDEVVRLLEERHAKKYCVYNLCVERTYDSAKFQGRVEQFPMRDHNPPPIHIIPSFCESVYNWLKKGTDYVAAIHCKAGKGRTGAMVCCYLLFESFHGLHGQQPKFLTAEEVMQLYGEKRTHDKKGVTIPSQRRYVFYYAHMLHKQLSLKPCRLLLTSVLVENGLPAIQSGCCMLFKCRQMANCQDGKSKYVTIGEAECGEPRRAQSSLGFCIRPPAPIPVCGDFKLVFYNRGKLLARLDKLFHCWLNTFFVVNQPPDTPGALRCPDRAGLCVTLTKGELDRACKDTQHRVFPEGFAITVYSALPTCIEFVDGVSGAVATASVASSASSSSSCSSITDDSDCCEFPYVPAAAPSASFGDSPAPARVNGSPAATVTASAPRPQQQRHRHGHRHHCRASNSPSPVPAAALHQSVPEEETAEIVTTAL
ncbi:hypothetical protein BOX15_Mlig032247g2 [Macrostomum lignano]|uniref:Phosphatidylinositol 3,4,5-trisphosphate 3-phosphatase and dual-specificity protein phosphatase PTEN n=1 Tax=Macrostomum lignano TaxID=282301 RepID=A0A267G4H2_9PLAT|nr:hypothetical protein BOX15_Mlig032247g2 [Macrostomum lignano]